MSAASATVRTNIQAQGFCGWDDDTYAQINYPLRLRIGNCNAHRGRLGFSGRHALGRKRSRLGPCVAGTA